MPQLRHGDPGAGELPSGVTGAETGQEQLVLVCGEPLRAAAQHPADAVERVAVRAAELLLYPAPKPLHAGWAERGGRSRRTTTTPLAPPPR